MKRLFLAALVPAALLSACISESARSVYLPPGDVEAGKEAFREFRCFACHAVTGEEFPPQGASPPTDVTLGENWDRWISDNELVTAIINPSHKIDPTYEKERVTSFAGGSRMAHYGNIMTVQQLADLVAFLRDVNEKARARK